MLITVTCPMCGTEAQIEESLLGKKLRCANPECRKPFRLTPDGEAVPVSDRVERVEAGADWMSNPPPLAGAEPDWATSPPGGGGQFFQAELLDDEGNPVESAAPYAADAPAGPGGDYHHYYPPRRNRTRNLAIGFVVVSVIALAAVFWLFLSRSSDTRKTMEDEAKKYLNEGDFSRAKRAYEDLKQRYPDSREQNRYDFYIKWAGIQVDLSSGKPDVLGQVQRELSTFVRDHRGDDLFKDENYRSKSWTTAIEVAERAAEQADRTADPRMLTTAKEALAIAEDARSGERDQDAALTRQKAVEAKLQVASEAIAAATARRKFDEEINAVIEAQTSARLEQLQQSFTRLLDEHPRLKDDRDLAQRVEQLRQDEPVWIRYVAVNQPPSKLPPGKMPPSLVMCPPLVPGPAEPPADSDPNRCVLALARGTLYGLKAWNGEPKWAMRVGIDVTQLPARLPTRRGEPELALVISVESNNQTFLSALDISSGERLWSRALSDRSFAGVLLVGQRAYVPTRDGRLNVIGLDGRLIGYFDTGHPLTVQPVVDPITNKLYQPADAKRIFVFNLATNMCEDVLYTDHPAGGLRGPPVLVPPSPGEAGAAGTLITAEATGVGSMVLRAFSTQSRGQDFRPVAEFTVPGWSWFGSEFDGDTVGLATDKGFLGLFGVNRGTKDTPLFRLTERPLSIAIGETATPNAINPVGPAQIAHVGLNEFWVLVDGKLHRRLFDPYRQQLVPAGEPLELGTPLQPSVLSPDQRHVIIVTQERERALVTAVDRLTGTITWQRQLGLVPAQEPVTLGNRVVTVDKSGALFVLNEVAIPEGEDALPWVSAGEWPAGRIRGVSMVRLAPMPDGKGAIVVGYIAASEQLVLRRFELDRGITAERTFRLPSPPHGTAAATAEGSIVVPCRDGNLREYFLDGPLSASGAPVTWRDANSPTAVPGHALVIGNELLATDGGRRILRWERTSDRRWQKVDGDLLLSGRLATPLLPFTLGEQNCVIVGDEGGRIYLASISGLPIQREWQTGGRITKGPFRLGDLYLGCVVEQRRLVWFDPTKELNQSPPREHEVAQGIVGEPAVVGSLLLIPTLGSGYIWMNLEQRGPGAPPVPLAAALVPAFGVAALGAERLFAPLSDGTALLLPVPAASAGPRSAAR